MITFFIEILELRKLEWPFLQVCSRKRQTVLRTFKQFLELLNSSWKSQNVLRTFQQFLEVSKSSRKFQNILEASNSYQKFQTVLENHKQFLVVSMSCWGSKKFPEIFKKFYVQSESVYTAITRCVGKIGTLQQNPRINRLKEFSLLLK